MAFGFSGFTSPYYLKEDPARINQSRMEFNRPKVGVGYIDSNSFSREHGSFGGDSWNRSSERGEYGFRNNDKERSSTNDGGYQHYKNTNEIAWVRDAPKPVQHLDAVGKIGNCTQLRNRMPFIPEPGKLGGMDTVLKRGLSGSGKKWYRRYREQGLPPDEALKKALEHKAKGTEPGAKNKREGESIVFIHKDFNQRKVGMEYIDSNSFSRKRGSFGGDSRNRSSERGVGFRNNDNERSSRNDGGYQHYKNTKEIPRVRDSPKRVQYLNDPILSDYIVLDAVGKVHRNKQSRARLPFIPELGQPGGVDDELRRGLSGAGVRWYLRYLKQGLPPEEAKKKALEHRVNPREEPDSEKREEAEPDVKNRKGDESSTTSAAVKAERMVVLPKSYPHTILSKDEQSLVEEAIVQEMLDGSEHTLQFGGIHFRQGFILVDCETLHSAEWLRMKIPQLKWKGVELTTCTEDNIPKIHRITLYLPRSQGLTADKFLQLIKVQNEGLQVTQWKILNLKDEGEGQILTARIDDLSCQKIKEKGYTIHYMFGNIPVNILKDSENTAEPTKGEDVKSVEHFSSPDERKSPKRMEIIEAKEWESILPDGDDVPTK